MGIVELLTYEWVVAILVGLGGGIVNAVFFGGGFAMPKRTTLQDGRAFFDPGFLGAILVSVAAAFLTWSYSTDASFADQERSVKPIAGALVAGITGSHALNIIVSRVYGQTVTEQTESAAESLATSVANLTRERDEARAVAEELRQQNRELVGGQREDSGGSGD